MEGLISLGRRLPGGLRSWLRGSALAPVLRRLLNRRVTSEDRLRVVELAGALSGHRMRLDWLTQKAFVFGVYELEVVLGIEARVKPGWTAVDVGAHIGYHTLLLAKLVGPRGRVVAFEPWWQNAAVLEENVNLNGYRNVTVVPKAVSDRSGQLRLRRPDTDPLSSMTAIAVDGDLRVSSVSLDAYFAPGAEVDFIKIDAEGEETRVLKGMARLLERDRPVVLLEVHGEAARHPALDTLRAAGYDVTPISQAGHHFVGRPV